MLEHTALFSCCLYLFGGPWLAFCSAAMLLPCAHFCPWSSKERQLIGTNYFVFWQKNPSKLHAFQPADLVTSNVTASPVLGAKALKTAIS